MPKFRITFRLVKSDAVELEAASEEIAMDNLHMMFEEQQSHIKLQQAQAMIDGNEMEAANLRAQMEDLEITSVTELP